MALRILAKCLLWVMWSAVFVLSASFLLFGRMEPNADYVAVVTALVLPPTAASLSRLRVFKQLGSKLAWTVFLAISVPVFVFALALEFHPLTRYSEFCMKNGGQSIACGTVFLAYFATTVRLLHRGDGDPKTLAGGLLALSLFFVVVSLITISAARSGWGHHHPDLPMCLIVFSGYGLFWFVIGVLSSRLDRVLRTKLITWRS